MIGSDSAVMKWKKIFSGHEEWRRMEWTVAMLPRRYPESRVIAMWTKDMSQLNATSLRFVGIIHSAPFLYCGASEKRDTPSKPVSLGNERIPAQNGAKKQHRTTKTTPFNLKGSI